MKNAELYEVKAKVNSILTACKSQKLIYAVNKNCARLESETREMDRIKAPSEKFTEFEQKRVKLCMDNSNKDARGQPKTVNGPMGPEFDIADKAAFDVLLTALKTEYAAEIKEYETKQELYARAMEEENDDLKIYRLKYSVFEKEQSELAIADRLSAAQVKALWFMLDDDMTEEMPAAPNLKMTK